MRPLMEIYIMAELDVAMARYYNRDYIGILYDHSEFSLV